MSPPSPPLPQMAALLIPHVKRLNADTRCLHLNLVSETHRFLYTPYPIAPNCPWTLCPFRLTKWRACCQISLAVSPHVLKTCSSALAHPLSVLFSLSFAQGHLPSAWKSENIAALHKKVQKQISATSDQSAFSQSSARLWNPSSLQTSNPSSCPMAWFPIINLVSDLVTLPWICCFCSPNNGWRYSIPDVKSEPYPWTYRVLLTRSGTLTCSPNSPPMVSKDISTHGSQTSSPVTVNVWP